MVRGLRKYLTPFAPDQSGAVSVLYELGGMVVILDAGGCTGNICGFDEPRWSHKRSAIFSAGLRDMDAIMGRDRELVKKIAGAQEKLQAKFIAIVGTPVPAVIGTDYQALRRMLQSKVSVPVLCIDTNGMRSFEYGAEKAYLALLEAFAVGQGCAQISENAEVSGASARIGVFGSFPMTECFPEERDWIKDAIRRDLSAPAGNTDVIFYGHGAALEDYVSAGQNVLNLVTSVPGLAPARWLEKHFGTPYRIGHPLAEGLPEKMAIHAWKPDPVTENGKSPRILIIHEQILGNSMRELLRRDRFTPEIQVMSFFRMEKALQEPGDRYLSEEQEAYEVLNQPDETAYDLIIGDAVLKRMLPMGFKGDFWAVPEPAVSGFWK